MRKSNLPLLFVCLARAVILVLSLRIASTDLIKNLCISVSAAVALLVSTVTDTHTVSGDVH